MTDFITRFAPSPTGLLHLGHAYAAMIAFDAAQDAGGRLLLRIEDIDQTRCKPDFEDAIYNDLPWLGLVWDEPVRRQSDHFSSYQTALDTLIERGLVYRCFRTRKQIADDIARAPHLGADGPEGPQFIGAPLTAYEERSLLAQGSSYAWRLSMSAARDTLGKVIDELEFTVEDIDTPHAKTRHKATPEIFGDVVIGRKDSGTSYHLACTYDDAAQGITHVIRGEDLSSAAHLHVLLQALLGLPTPIYRHHRLILDDHGKRLAKRNHAATLRSIRKNGADASWVRQKLNLRPA